MLDVIRDYVQINGREALSHLLAGKEVYGTEGEEVWKIINGELRVRDYSREEEFEKSNLELNVFLDQKDDDWYVAPPFDVRKELLDHPGEWVAKYTTFGKWYYIGFDFDEMVAIQSDNMINEVDYNDDSIDLVHTYGIKNAIPLDKEDLNFLAAFKSK